MTAAAGPPTPPTGGAGTAGPTSTDPGPRWRRLRADAEAVQAAFAGCRAVTVTPLDGHPPERYRLTYRVPGLRLDPGAVRPVVVGEHRVLVHLPAGYPRSRPHVVAETAVFHPNVGPGPGAEVCVGDHWTPTRSLVDLVVAIGALIQGQSLNPASPLDAVAAAWAAEHRHRFPIGTVALGPAAVPPTAPPPTGDPLDTVRLRPARP